MPEKVSLPELVPRRLLIVKRFQDDVRAFLSLPHSTVLAISQIVADSDGFAVSKKAPILAQQCSLAYAKAAQVLTTARYFYDRSTEKGISSEGTIEALSAIASSLEIPPFSSELRQALEKLFAYKNAYEKGEFARSQAAHNGPHFLDLQGSWSFAVFRTRQGESVKVPILGLSVSWHDRQGNDHEAFFQMTDPQWEEFKAAITDIDQARDHLKKLLNE
jgi:hypothetical protein